VSFIDGMGLKVFVARTKELATKYGPQFEPGEKLIRMAERGETFYGSYNEKRKAA
jgi:3-hydroxyacyl-CoA dehydrogenase/enoyl-CoA hydratase/3-hydroxybutyryl-CoA epimerase